MAQAAAVLPPFAFWHAFTHEELFLCVVSLLKNRGTCLLGSALLLAIIRYIILAVGLMKKRFAAVHFMVLLNIFQSLINTIMCDIVCDNKAAQIFKCAPNLQTYLLYCKFVHYFFQVPVC